MRSRRELGDVLFSAANVSRFLDCDAEEALDAATVKFSGASGNGTPGRRPAGLRGG